MILIKVLESLYIEECHDSRDKWTIALRLGSKNCTEKLLAR
jgi:hypothetical protein